MLENTSSEKLQSKALQFAKLLNGLSITDARYIILFISQNLDRQSIVAFEARPID
ncbi:hypothetical protein AAEO57_19975 [Flavobacterium sp. DGU38]|uniref:Uncharacterized protein n=1 Tax=Flavobacterium calami TaxID=3139144 RepID=A0ABU9IUE7_9FLAO